ncbi:hypothetical protein [Anaerospora hongkongensis]|uniref:hypothetical protein n=1 Tax=Anaerospora hongkongensis TaxID=244830 RepID=UPI002FDB4CB1
MNVETIMSIVNMDFRSMNTFTVLTNIIIVYFALRMLDSVLKWFFNLIFTKSKKNSDLVYDVDGNIVFSADGKPMKRHSDEHYRLVEEHRREHEEYFERVRKLKMYGLIK